MKKRKGFVSNSSSSSFILYVKDDTLSTEELIKKTFNSYTKAFGKNTVKEMDDDNNDQWLTKKATKLAEENKHITMIKSVEWGCEEAIDEIIPSILETLGVSKDKIYYEWGE